MAPTQLRGRSMLTRTPNALYLCASCRKTKLQRYIQRTSRSSEERGRGGKGGRQKLQKSDGGGKKPVYHPRTSDGQEQRVETGDAEGFPQPYGGAVSGTLIAPLPVLNRRQNVGRVYSSVWHVMSWLVDWLIGCLVAIVESCRRPRDERRGIAVQLCRARIL